MCIAPIPEPEVKRGNDLYISTLHIFIKSNRCYIGERLLNVQISFCKEMVAIPVKL